MNGVAPIASTVYKKGCKKGGEMREYSRNPTYPDGDAYDPTYSPVTETKDKEKETEMKANTKEKEEK